MATPLISGRGPPCRDNVNSSYSMNISEYTLPETNIAPDSQRLEDWISFWDGGAMSVSGRVVPTKPSKEFQIPGRVSIIFSP